MKWIQATLTFTPDQVNMARKGKLGAWRICDCSAVGNPLITRVDDFSNRPDLGQWNGRKVLRLMVARPYPRGVMVNPLRLALAFNVVARAERARIARIEAAHNGPLYFGKAAHG